MNIVSIISRVRDQQKVGKLRALEESVESFKANSLKIALFSNLTEPFNFDLLSKLAEDVWQLCQTGAGFCTLPFQDGQIRLSFYDDRNTYRCACHKLIKDEEWLGNTCHSCNLIMLNRKNIVTTKWYKERDGYTQYQHTVENIFVHELVHYIQLSFRQYACSCGEMLSPKESDAYACQVIYELKKFGCLSKDTRSALRSYEQGISYPSGCGTHTVYDLLRRLKTYSKHFGLDDKGLQLIGFDYDLRKVYEDIVRWAMQWDQDVNHYHVGREGLLAT